MRNFTRSCGPRDLLQIRVAGSDAFLSSQLNIGDYLCICLLEVSIAMRRVSIGLWGQLRLLG